MGLPGLASGGNAGTNPITQDELHCLLELPVSVTAVRRHRRPRQTGGFVQALRHGSTASWRHVNLLGEYDFSDERLKDPVGIKPPKLID